jgi:hypothetical protein
MRVFVASVFLISLLPHMSNAGKGDADAKVVQRVVQEIELVPSLYARDEKAATLPKFAAAKLAAYEPSDQDVLEYTRRLWISDKAGYAKTYPLRAAIFDAAQESAELTRLKLVTTLPLKLVTGKQKTAIVLQGPAALGMAIFKQEQVHAQFIEAATTRDNEKSVRWKADFDVAQARVQVNLIFLFEYNFTLGQVRADNLPELGKDHDGWKIGSRQKITVTEPKAKNLAKSRATLLKKIQEEHAGTPWAHFAERELAREIGMGWEPKKK